MEVVENKAWQELLAAAQKGLSQAQWEIGLYHEYGAEDEEGRTLAEPDISKAIDWYTQSAEQGNIDAQNSLGVILSSGEDPHRDFEKAIFWLEKAIEQGYATAASNLGTVYRDLRQPAMALRCYEQAVAMGDIDALLQVALSYFFGVGVDQDAHAAYTYLNKISTSDPIKSCQRTKEDALYWSAIFQLAGIGGAERSVCEARSKLERANQDDDHEQANEILNLIGKSKYLVKKSG